MAARILKSGFVVSAIIVNVVEILNQVFNNDEIVTEITETEAVTHLTAVQVK